MPKKPIETVVYTISLYEKTVHVRSSYYEDGVLSATSGHVVPIPGVWRGVRAALLEAWPTREDVSDGVQEVGTLHVGPQETDVDVPEV
jgi:hypothetical protein